MSEGRVWRYGDNVDTDVIIPARYLMTSDENVLATHAMEDLDPRFASEVEPGDVVVAGANFGCGSSREHAATCLKAAGVSVVAASFARIFFRNAINTGLTAVVCPEAVAATAAGDRLTVDVERGVVVNHSKGLTFETERLPDFVMDIVEAGGLVPWVRSALERAAEEKRRTLEGRV